MLASLLPGLRHLRAPLATGYLYLLALWLTVGDRILPDDDARGAAGNLADLAALLGPTATVAALSFTAYLIGSILVISHWPRTASIVDERSSDDNPRPVSWASGAWDWVTMVVRPLAGRLTMGDLLRDRTLPNALVRKAIRWNEDDHVSDRVLDVLQDDDLDPTRSLGDLPSAERARYEELAAETAQKMDNEALEMALLYEIDDEIPRVVARLRVERELVYNEYDRTRSEAELRFSIAVPLTLVILVTVFSWNAWAIIGIVAPLALLRQGLTLERESIRIVVDALRYRIVESPTAQALSTLARDASAH